MGLCGVHGHLVHHRLARALVAGRAVVRVVREIGERTATYLTQRACYVLVPFLVLGLVEYAQRPPHEPLPLCCLAESELPLRQLSRVSLPVGMSPLRA